LLITIILEMNRGGGKWLIGVRESAQILV
jgi:hypothetical protein